MADHDRQDVTLETLHEDLTSGFGEMRAGFTGLRTDITGLRTEIGDLRTETRAGFADLKIEMQAGFADLKTTLVTGFRSLPTRESSEEMVRLLREANRLNEERFTRLDVGIREQHLEVQQVLHTLVDGQRLLIESQRVLSEDLRALIARIDALIRGRGDGGSAA
jgi:hypothetical protein